MNWAALARFVRLSWRDDRNVSGARRRALLAALAAGYPLLEAANWAFLAKRQRITRLNEELEEAESEARHLRQKI